MVKAKKTTKKTVKSRTAAAKKTASSKKKTAPASKAAKKKPVAKKAAKPEKKKVAKKATPASTAKKADKVGKKAKPAKALPAKAAAEPKVRKSEAVAEAAPLKAKEGRRKSEAAPRREEKAAPPPEVRDAELGEEELDGEGEIILTDAEGRRYCRVKECDQIAVVDTYCRYHYLLFWKKIQVRKKILSEGKLARYVEELTARYPDKYLELLRKDLRHEKDFLAAIHELEIDESAVDTEYEDEAQSYIEEVRGMSGEGSGREDEEY